MPTWKWNVELPEKSEVVIFDLDGVICTNTYGNYKDAKPLKKSIDKICVKKIILY